MARSRPWSDANPDLRRRCQMTAPPIELMEEMLLRSLNPSSFKPISGLKGTHKKK